MPQEPSAIVEAMPVSILTQTQKDDLLFMYQEEKVARDIYLTENFAKPKNTL